MCCLHYKNHRERLQTLFEKSIDTFPSKLMQDLGLSITEMFVSACYNEIHKKLIIDYETKNKFQFSSF